MSEIKVSKIDGIAQSLDQITVPIGNNLNIEGKLDLSGNTGAFQLPSGTTAQRPASPNVGYARFNTSNETLEIWNGADWQEYPEGAAPTTMTQIFTYNGGLQTFTWPTHTSKISIRFIVVGAGGGSGSSAAGWGGEGGFTDYTQTSSFSNTYTILVGQAGPENSRGNAWGGGGDGGYMDGRSQYGGSGGGGSFVFNDSITTFDARNSYHNSIICAAGGGGGTFFAASAQSGGNGGGTVGQDGQRGTTTGNGTGGTQSATGTNGPSYGSGSGLVAPSNHQGGICYQSGYEYGGGGGGGGYYGGGAGGSCVTVCPGSSGNGAGGGGSGYINTGLGSGTLTQGQDTGSEYYDSAYGGPAQNGRVVVIASYFV